MLGPHDTHAMLKMSPVPWRIGAAMVAIAVAVAGASSYATAADRSVSSVGHDRSDTPCIPSDGKTCEESPVTVPSRVSLNNPRFRAFRHHRNDPFSRTTTDAPRLAVLTRLALEGRRPLFPNWRRGERTSVDGTPFPARMSRFADLTVPLPRSVNLFPPWIADPARWGAVQESILATSSDCPCLRVLSPGEVPDGYLVPGMQFMVAKNEIDPDYLDLSWDESCLSTANDYSIYEGAIGTWDSHSFRTCTTGGSLTYTLPAGPGGRYYLIVPLSHNAEGSYGTDSDGAQRPPAAEKCRYNVAVDPCP